MQKILIILILLSSCDSTKRCLKHVEKAKKKGCLTFTDSVRITDSTRLYLDTQRVVTAVDSIIGVIDCDSLTDTLYLTRFKERVKTIVSNIPCKITPTMYANKEYSLKIWTNGGKLFYDLKIEPNPEKVCEPIKWLDKFWIGFAIGSLLTIVWVFIIKKYT